MLWVGNTLRVGKVENTCNMLIGKHGGKRWFGRSALTWKVKNKFDSHEKLWLHAVNETGSEYFSRGRKFVLNCGEAIGLRRSYVRIVDTAAMNVQVQVILWPTVSLPVRLGVEPPVRPMEKKNSMVWVREQTIPTERPPLVGELIANFCG
jgi:hypothetical protein